ncbi:MAG: class I SAM-dependent methyltransferase [Anaerolineales bacterium]|nr:class I SAM-dependent methyltransferase [Anaerolineales bacterium]
MKLENVDWTKYYDKIQGRSPRPLLRAALELEETTIRANGRMAIDLGCGDGTDTLFLLEKGWQVLAIDGELAAIDHLLPKIPDDLIGNLQTQIAQFEQIELPPAHFIHASLSLPFCHPDSFPHLWQKIEQSLGENGRFAGNFFGTHDSWAVNEHMTFHLKAEVQALFSNFSLEHFHEQDAPGRSASGPKHWHIFTVIAKKNE